MAVSDLKPPRVAVIGTLAVDETVRVARLPQAGETVSVRDSTLEPGGKGLNYAIAAHRLGAEVTLLGRLGRDDGSRIVLETVRREALEILHLETDETHPTARSTVVVDEAGHNLVLTRLGAAARFAGEALERAFDPEPDVLVMQVEFDPNIALLAVRATAAPLVLNLAPYRRLPPALLERMDTLIVNEIEFRALTGSDPTTSGECLEALWAALPTRPRVIVTLGPRGCLLADRRGLSHAPAHNVRNADSTGAGDAFVAGYSVARASGQDAAHAGLLAQAVAALSIQSHGAQAGLPTLEEARALQTLQPNVFRACSSDDGLTDSRCNR